VLVIEIVCPGDETWAKLSFYAKHGVEELVIIDPETRAVQWLGLWPA
jgi:Uma2 family endonuclease